MIRINLIPFRAKRKKENIQRQVSLFLLSIICLVLLMVYGVMHLNSKIKEVDAKVKDIKIEYAKVEKKAKEVDKIKKDLNFLNKKTDVIKNLLLNRTEPVVLLDTMPKIVVEKRMWFTGFEAKGYVVSIKGIAIDNKTTADFMTRLEDSGLFSSVNLKTLKQSKLKNGMNLKGFEITCKKVPLKKDDGKKAKNNGKN